MKPIYILFLFALLVPFQAAKAEMLSLETVIEQALQNSPETARILNNVANAEAEAFEASRADHHKGWGAGMDQMEKYLTSL